MNWMGIVYFFGLFPMSMIGLCMAVSAMEKHERGEHHV